MLKILFHQLPKRLTLPYRNGLWFWHIVAVVATAIIVLTGFDWWFFRHTRSEVFVPLIRLGGLGGMLVPILLPIALYILARDKKDEYLLRVAVAVTQAAAVAWIIVAVYKAFTGRIQPKALFAADTMSASSGFLFGFWEHGIFWGWPSHHTVVAVAMATVLFLAFRSPLVRLGAIAWAVIVATAAAVGFHWFSDAVAGAIVGVVTGFAIWKDVKKSPIELE